jgi:hypothetical protein
MTVPPLRGPVGAVESWPPHPTSAGAARRFLTTTLRGWGLEAVVDDGALVITELVTNAVRHAGTAVSVTLSRLPDGVLVRVNDSSSAQPVREVGTHVSATGGRGLSMVGSLATGWGVVPDGRGGKAVWAVLSDRGRGGHPAPFG